MISEAHNTVFVHIPKTGGQSIETMFLKSLGLKWEDRAPLLLRFNPDRNLGPERLAHLFGHEYEKLGYAQRKLETYFSFAFVRNPYDRAVSEFNFRKQSKNQTVRDFFSKIKTDTYTDSWRHICPQTNYVFDEAGERPIVENIFRFEEMAQRWPQISETVLGKKTSLPHVNKPRTYRLQASDLSRGDIDYINELYQDDFRNFDYQIR